MTGTIINIITVLLGSMLGLIFGARLPERMRQTVIAGIGLFTFAIGIQMFLKTGEPIIVLGSILIGGIIGEWVKIEKKLHDFGEWLERKYAQPVNSPGSVRSSTFVQGFLTASLLFCVGPMTILGAIQDGLSGDYHLLAIKAVLDGFAALALASTLGQGVLFSILIIFGYQGGLTLLANQVQLFVSDQMVLEMTAVGGLMLVGLAISSLLEIKKIRTGNFLPALIIAPLIVAILSFF